MIRQRIFDSGPIRRRYHTALRGHNGFPYSVALIDLFFLLLLFITMSTLEVRISGIRVDLPKVDAPMETVVDKLIVTVKPLDYDGGYEIYFRDRKVTEDELRRIFSGDKHRRYKTVVVRADRSLPSGVLYKVVACARDNEMAVLIAVQPQDVRQETRFE